MSEYVEVPFEGKAQERAILLLAAAEDLELDQQAVVQTRTGAFYVPSEVAEKAGLASSKSDESEGDSEEQSEEKPKARKRAAKKSTSSNNQE